MKGRIFSAGLVAACAAALVAPGAASAVGTLDQQQLLSNQATQVQSSQSASQVITAGITGAMDQVDLLLGCGGVCPQTAPLTVQIRNVVGGEPGTTVLATSSVAPSAAADAFVPVTFAAPAQVTTGTQYAIVAFSATPPANQYTWMAQNANVYTGGAGLFAASSPPTTAWQPSTGYDQAFKTYVTKPVAAGPTGKRAAALKKCKKKKSKKAKKKCRKKAKKLPV